jgi:hypothetical protein
LVCDKNDGGPRDNEGRGDSVLALFGLFCHEQRQRLVQLLGEGSRMGLNEPGLLDDFRAVCPAGQWPLESGVGHHLVIQITGTIQFEPRMDTDKHG